MAETATTKTTTPRRGAAGRTRKAPAAKTVPPAAAAAAATTKVDPAGKATADQDESGKERLTFELDYVEDTRSFAKFAVPDEYKAHGVAGTIYAPHGTDTVKLLIVSPE